MKQYKYKAFISYRHQSFDKEVAEKLVQLLESYRLPKNLSLQSEKIVIFRDKDELPLSNNLNQDIKNALNDSEFLIVVCSPALTDPNSKWCREEVRYFKELHHGSTSNIITVLISGTPEESFLEELKYSVENGENIEVEPLAADIVAEREKESFRLLKTEYLRILARFYNVGYNKLYQREVKRSKKKRLLWTGGISCVLLTVAIITTVFSIQLFKKNKRISRLYSETLAEEADLLWQNGSFYSAMEKSVAALKADNDNGSEKAIYTLSSALDVFNPTTFLPQVKIELIDDIICAEFVNNGKTVLAIDKNAVYLFDADSGSLNRRIPNNELGNGFTLKSHYAKLVYQKKGLIYLSDTDGCSLCCIDCDQLTIEWKQELTTFGGGELQFQEEDELLFSSSLRYSNGELLKSRDFTVFSLKTGEVILSAVLNDEIKDCRSFYYDQNKNLLICTIENEIVTFSTVDGVLGPPTVIYSVYMKNGNTEYARINGALLKIGSFLEPVKLADNLIFVFFGTDGEERVVSISLEELSVNWNTILREPLNYIEEKGFLISDICSGSWTSSQTDASKSVVFVSNKNEIRFISAEDGQILFAKKLNDDIKKVKVNSDNNIVIITENHAMVLTSEILLQETLSKTIDSTIFLSLQQFPSAISVCSEEKGRYLFAQKNSTIAYIAEKQGNIDYLDNEEFLSNDSLSGDCWIATNPYGDNSIITNCNYNEESNQSERSYYVCSVNENSVSSISPIAGNKLNFIGYLSNEIACFAQNISAEGEKLKQKLLYYDMQNLDWLGEENDLCSSVVVIDRFIFSYQYNTNDEIEKIYRCSLDNNVEIWESDEYICQNYYPSPDGNRLALILKHRTSDLISVGCWNYSDAKLTILPTTYNNKLDRMVWCDNTTIAISYTNLESVTFIDMKSGNAYPVTINLNDKENSSSSARVTNMFYMKEKDVFVLVHQDGIIEMYSNLLVQVRNNSQLRPDCNIIIEDISLMTRQSGTVDLRYYAKTKVFILSKNTGLVNDSEAWILSGDNMEILFHVDNYWGYSPILNRVFVRQTYSDEIESIRTNGDAFYCGSFPLYSTTQLIQKAESILY